MVDFHGYVSLLVYRSVYYQAKQCIYYGQKNSKYLKIIPQM